MVGVRAARDRYLGGHAEYAIFDMIRRTSSRMTILALCVGRDVGKIPILLSKLDLSLSHAINTKSTNFMLATFV